MKFTVYLVADAAADLLDIHRYVAQNHSPSKAGKLLDILEKTILVLRRCPCVAIVHRSLSGL